MKIGIIGGGAWGTTLGQTLIDNGHQVLVYDLNPFAVDKINSHLHPFFDTVLPESEKATLNLNEVIDFADMLLLSVPTKAVRSVLKEINALLNKKMTFINVSKGIEPETLKRVSEIVEEEISPEYLQGFVVLTGPSHAEEVIIRKLTLLVSSSKDEKLAKKVQQIFSNDQSSFQKIPE